MPLVNITVPEGSLSDEKKKRMIELVTDAVVEAEGYGDAFTEILRNAYLAMAGEPHGDFPTFADGHRGMQLLDAALRSAREGGWVTV